MSYNPVQTGFLFPSVFLPSSTEAFLEATKRQGATMGKYFLKIKNTTFFFRKSTAYDAHFTCQTSKMCSIVEYDDNSSGYPQALTGFPLHFLGMQISWGYLSGNLDHL